MGKVRVHQLAKELKMETTELIPKLKELGINVTTHMNALTDEAVTRVRKRFSGKENWQEIIEEERITSTIIRRRSREVMPEPAPPEDSVQEETKIIASKEVEPPSLPQKIKSKIETPKTKISKKKGIPDAIKIDVEKKGVGLAKIIKKAEPKQETPKKVPAPKEFKKPAVAITTENKKKKKGKGKSSVTSSDDTLFKSKVPRKKREVTRVEDLYGEDDKAVRYRSPRAKATKGTTKVSPHKPQITVPKAIKRKIRVFEGITVGELSKKMSVKANDLIKELMKLGTIATINHLIDVDTATLVSSNFNYEIEEVSLEKELLIEEKQDHPDVLESRPPVVTVMGHVDHGKTSLLDAIRNTNVIEGEAGGITQHIGAYHVSLERGDIVFLDTPGHEAFTSMRARGAQVTDLVVLVVAADEGVKAQTEEAINHAKAAKVPIIVAINKIDKPNANPERIKQDLTALELVPEDWGGETIFVEVSAKQEKGIKDLLEMILLQAEILELKANPNKFARGAIIEARLDRTQGPVVSVLIQGGSLKIGDPFIAGANFGKVRSLINDKGKKITSAGPSMPVEVHGISGVPKAGDILVVLDEERKARQIGLYRQQKQRKNELFQVQRATTLEELSDQIQKGETKELNVVIKADVQGSIEALTESLKRYDTQDVKLRIIHKGVGAISEMDVILAGSSNAIIVGYNIKPDSHIQQISKGKVDIRYYKIIYEVITDIKDAMKGLLPPVLKETLLGRAEIRSLFNVPKIGIIAGSYVTDGKIIRGSHIRLIRNDVVIYKGKMASLKRFKDDVKEVLTGFECGIGIHDFNNIESHDIIESFNYEEVPV